jgi:hypothetical protein
LGGHDRRTPGLLPTAHWPLTGNQIMNILDHFVSNNPDASDKTYGFALSTSLIRAFPCTPG